jgi:hypothetical protein
VGLATIFYCLRFEIPFSSPPATRRAMVEVFTIYVASARKALKTQLPAITPSLRAHVVSHGFGIVVCLHSCCLVIAVSPGSTVPALSKYVKVLRGRDFNFDLYRFSINLYFT